MKTLPVAAQIYSVREEAQMDFKGTMLKLKNIGYSGVELAGLYGKTSGEIKSILGEVGLKAVSAHVPFGEFAEDVRGTVEKYKEIGCEYLALPYLPENMRPDACDFNTVIAEIEKIGRVCADKGITLLYHNHDFEFEKTKDGSYCLDYIYNHIPKQFLQAEPDTCWIHVSGIDPSEYMRKYTGRCPIVHLKDYMGVKSNKMYGLIGKDEGNKEADNTEFKFCPLGLGKQNISEILNASVETGAKWVIVEQDLSPDRPPLAAMQISREYLAKLGW